MVKCSCGKNLGRYPAIKLIDYNSNEYVFCLECYNSLTNEQKKSTTFIGDKGIFIKGDILGTICLGLAPCGLFYLLLGTPFNIPGMLGGLMGASFGYKGTKKREVSKYENYINQSNFDMQYIDNYSIDIFGSHFWLLKKEQKEEITRGLKNENY